MLRPASDAEMEEVAGFFDAIERDLAEAVFGDLAVAVVERDDAIAVTLIAPEVFGLDAALTADADHGGLRIGTLEDDEFRLDLQGAFRMVQHTRRLCVRVNEKATRLWLYGRDMLGVSVTDHDRRLKPGDACIVCNLRWEAIGIGEVMSNFKGMLPAVRPVHDLGAYLRDQD